MLLSFDRLRDGPGLEIVDHVERRQCTIRTPVPVDPTPTDVEVFHYPVDRGATIRTDAITLPHTMAALLRNSSGFLVEELTKGESRRLPRDRYSIELSAPVKLYIVVESALTAAVSADEVRFEFDEATDVAIGARSYHKHPAGTITTTADPEAMMVAVSALGSALKTTTVERSYPTLRGHPPTIELGDELHVPEGLERPDTGVTIEVPPELRYVFVVAPLAYYLGAEVVSGPVPRIVTDRGFEHELDDPARGFEGEVERVLKQVFFLDCIVRTEGYYPVNLHERNVLEQDLDLEPAALYDVSLAEQLEAYLGVPYELLQPELPEWKLTAHVTLLPENVEVLPFVVNDLAVVRSPAGRRLTGDAVQTAAVEEFVRGGDFMRSSADDARASAGSATPPSLIRPEETDSLEQAWVGEDAPLGASKAMIEAFRNRLDRSPTDGDIDITVVCNDTAMNNERDIVDDIYGSRDELPFDVRVERELSVAELRTVLEAETDFLHYIGHIDERGFECADGMLDAGTLDHTGVEAFFLNACTSYQQGMELIRAGSVAGVVTLEDVINSGAETIGKTLAKLLNLGFPLRAALNISKKESIVGGHYLVLGDGGIDITQSESGIPTLCEISENDREEGYQLEYNTYLTSARGIGTISFPYISGNDEYYLSSGETGCFRVNETQLQEFLNAEVTPVIRDGKLSFTDRS